MTTQEMLDERYGRRHSRRRQVVGWAIVAAVALVVLVPLGWTTVQRSIATVNVDALGYDVTDQRTVTVSFQLTAPRDREIACALEAQDEEHGVVGWRVVTYPATDSHAQAYTETIPTVSLATTGLVNSCWLT